MKILNSKQLRAVDKYTEDNLPIDSIDLMEQAAKAFTIKFVRDLFGKKFQVGIFCGMGNNGGDGLAIARLLTDLGYTVHTFVVKHKDIGSADFQTNLKRLQNNPKAGITYIEKEEEIKNVTLANNEVIIDALFGTGLDRKIDGIFKPIVEFINQSKNPVVSVDLPSGLYADKPSNTENPIVQADITISFQLPKLAFFAPENEGFVGTWLLVDIGIHPAAIQQAVTPFILIDANTIIGTKIRKSRFVHKGSNGHVLCVGGSYGKIGAISLTSLATLKAGAGLVTTQVPNCGYAIMQTSVPEAMCISDDNPKIITNIPNADELKKYTTVAIGPGLGKDEATVQALKKLLTTVEYPLVLDADALNIIAENNWLHLIPEKSIITPHLGEFARLTKQDKIYGFLQWSHQLKMANEHKIIVVVKGAYTAVATPDGQLTFNSSGNPGLATAGSGDVLTGVIAGLLAQGYPPELAAIRGVYLHGHAGDVAYNKIGNFTARNIIEYFSEIRPQPQATPSKS